MRSNRKADSARPRPPPPRRRPAGPPRLSIVVLPFANIGGGPEQEHFVDGVTESLTTDLSRIRRRGRDRPQYGVHLQGQAARREGRSGAIERPLCPRGQRSARRKPHARQCALIDAETGSHLWAERFDKPLADLFDMQDEIVAHLANALNAQLVAAEARRAEQAPNPNSMDLYFQGLAWLNKGLTPDNVAQARGFFDRALAADPDYVDALIGSAGAGVIEGAYCALTDPVAAFAAAEAKLTKALSSVPDHARGHLLLGVVEILTRRAAEGIAECEHAWHWIEILPAPMRYRVWQDFARSRRRNGGSHCRGPAPQSARHAGLYLDGWGGRREAPPRPLGPSGRVVSTRDRGRPEYPHAYFLLAAALAQLGRPDERIPPSRPVSRSTPPSPFPPPRAAGRRRATTRRIWPGSRLFSKACARPGTRTMTAVRRLAAILGDSSPTLWGGSHKRPVETRVRRRFDCYTPDGQHRSCIGQANPVA